MQFVKHNKNEIISAIKLAIFDMNYRGKVDSCKNPYGDGQSSVRIANILATIKLDNKLLIKDITY